VSRREIIINTLLGLLLVAAFAAPFVLLCVVFHFVSLAVGPTLTRWASSLGLPHDFEYVALIVFLSISAGIGHVRKHYWPNAILCLLIISAVASSWLAGFGASNDLKILYWPTLALIVIGNDHKLVLWEVCLGTFLIVSALVRSIGLLGSGSLAQAFEFFTVVIAGLWLVIFVRRQSYGEPVSTNSSIAA
jgi:hypothetical protein